MCLLSLLPSSDGDVSYVLIGELGASRIIQRKVNLLYRMIAAIPEGVLLGPSVHQGHDLFEAVGVVAHESNIQDRRGPWGL